MTAERPSSPSTGILPAWSEPFRRERVPELTRRGPFEAAPEWLGSKGEGVTVAIVDSGVEGDHPAVGGRLVASVRIEIDDEDEPVVIDDDAIDVVGHGTACAGIIHAIAPSADLVSVRVLGKKNTAKGIAFARGLHWVVEQGIGVANLSLSSGSEELFAEFHELADQAYFENTVLVCAASNTPGRSSYPSLFSSVISVAAHDSPDPLTWFYNPRPPVEFGARGVDVPVAWRGGASIIGTGNSFATPHIAGLVARIRATYPDATPFEVKALLAASAGTPPQRSTGRSRRSPHSAHEPS